MCDAVVRRAAIDKVNTTTDLTSVGNWVFVSLMLSTVMEELLYKQIPYNSILPFPVLRYTRVPPAGLN